MIDSWAEDKTYTRADWHMSVANEDTQLGYWDWVEHMKEVYDGLIELDS